MPLELEKLIKNNSISSKEIDDLLNSRRNRALSILINSFNIDLVLDVGANTGQFAEFFRNNLGYEKQIISFEPMKKEYQVLLDKTAKEKKWSAFNYALGDTNQLSEINISGNSYSSSILNMLPSHAKSAPGSTYTCTETIEIKTLDSIFKGVSNKSKSIYLKIDTQGFEDKVLSGAKESIKYIDTIEIELSTIPLYQNQKLHYEISSFLADHGFSLAWITPGFYDPNTKQLLQFDGIFHRY